MQLNAHCTKGKLKPPEHNPVPQDRLWGLPVGSPASLASCGQVGRQVQGSPDGQVSLGTEVYFDGKTWPKHQLELKAP